LIVLLAGGFSNWELHGSGQGIAEMVIHIAVESELYFVTFLLKEDLQLLTSLNGRKCINLHAKYNFNFAAACK